MQQTLTLRAGTLADVPTIVAHRRAMFSEMGHVNRAELDQMDENFEEWVTEKLERGEYHNWFLTDEQDRIVAGAGVWLIPDYPPNPNDASTRRGLVLNVYTEPGYRKRGLARRLMATVMDWCREQGLKTLILHASDEARPLYESLGFRQTGEMRIQLSVPD